jgi:hypothetical protein
LCALADVDLEPLSAGRDRQALIAELADDVERFAHGLIQGEAQRIRRNRALDLDTHVRRRLEEAIGRDQSVERLMRSLEVVVGQVVHESLLRVDGVCEHRAAEELVPQGPPEPLHLAQRLRVLRPTADVQDAQPGERLFELGPSSPHRVLPAIVGQHLLRLTVRRHAVLERLHHQRRLLVVRERVTDDEPAVVIHEHAHVEPLRAPQPEREDVRLPQLVRCRALEPARLVLARWRRRRR